MVGSIPSQRSNGRVAQLAGGVCLRNRTVRVRIPPRPPSSLTMEGAAEWSASGPENRGLVMNQWGSIPPPSAKLPWWIRHWCAKRFAKSCAFQQTRVSSNLTSTAKCVGGRAANATACRAVLPCGANTGGSSPSRRTKFYGRLMATGRPAKLKPLRIGVRISGRPPNNVMRATTATD